MLNTCSVMKIKLRHNVLRVSMGVHLCTWLALGHWRIESCVEKGLRLVNITLDATETSVSRPKPATSTTETGFEIEKYVAADTSALSSGK